MSRYRGIDLFGVHYDDPDKRRRCCFSHQKAIEGSFIGIFLLLAWIWPGESRPGTTNARGSATALPSSLAHSTGRAFYVARNGSDTNPGTLKRAWRTIQKALDVLKPGQRALIRGGTYSADLLMSRAGTSSAPITLAAYPHERVVLRPGSVNGNAYPVEITSGAAYFRLHGFVIEGARGTSSANVYVSGVANHIEVSGNEIRHGQDQGIFGDPTTSFVYILGNRIHDNGWNHRPEQHQSHGIYIEGRKDLIANNVIYNHPYGFGIVLYPANHDTIVTDNTIVSSAHSSVVVGGSGGVYNITIRNNILYDDVWGVEMDSTCPSGRVTIDHNVISAYKVSSIGGGCGAVDASRGNILANPRFVDYSTRNLHLQPRSPAIDAALPGWSEPRDVDGRKRPHGRGPDVGAHER